MRNLTFAKRHRGPASMLEAYCDRVNNVYERVQAEAALVSARDEAEYRAKVARDAMIAAQTADRAKSEFLAAMSHELRTPLNAIIGFSDLLGSELGKREEAKLQEYAGDILESGHHLLGIITDILDVAKIDVGQFKLHEAKIDVGEYVEASIRLIRSRADEAKVAIETEVAAGLPAVFCDGRRIKQAILNLLSNAVKFTPPGGTIKISAELTKGGDLALDVADNGIGIEPGKVNEVLKPFVQADGRLSRVYEGTGLGLYITHSIISLHGGAIDITSGLGQGTTVTILLPKARLQAQAKPLRSHATVEEAPPSKAKSRKPAAKAKPAVRSKSGSKAQPGPKRKAKAAPKQAARRRTTAKKTAAKTVSKARKKPATRAKRAARPKNSVKRKPRGAAKKNG